MRDYFKNASERDWLLINTIRFLSVDQVERAKSGHPGMPLGASHITYIIYDRFLRFNPNDAFGWFVQEVEDGYDLAELERAIKRAMEQKQKPSFISVRTHLAYGSPKQDDASAHGAPFGKELALQTKKNFGWSEEEFFVPEEVWSYREEKIKRGELLEREWNALLERYRESHPESARLLEKSLSKDWEEDYRELLPEFKDAMATRQASGKVLASISKVIPTLFGGSADLSESNNTYLHGEGDFPQGRNLHFGVREHAMGTILNGMAYHGGIIPYGGTFLVFSDYMRPSIRMASLSNLQVVYVFTHDSIGLGEDGPTHQPVEQLSSLRLIPNLWVLRPADPNEVSIAWYMALKRKDGPTAIILTRQKVPLIDRQKYASQWFALKGAYVIADTEGTPDVIVFASGSEVYPSLMAKEILEKGGIKVRVVNVFSFEVFEHQPEEYKDHILAPEVKKRVAVEAGRGLLWHRFVGMDGLLITLEEFGRSAPGDVLMDYFGFSPEKIARRIKEWL
jgi:transketolase